MPGSWTYVGPDATLDQRLEADLPHAPYITNEGKKVGSVRRVWYRQGEDKILACTFDGAYGDECSVWTTEFKFDGNDVFGAEAFRALDVQMKGFFDDNPVGLPSGSSGAGFNKADIRQLGGPALILIPHQIMLAFRDGYWNALWTFNRVGRGRQPVATKKIH